MEGQSSPSAISLPVPPPFNNDTTTVVIQCQMRNLRYSNIQFLAMDCAVLILIHEEAIQTILIENKNECSSFCSCKLGITNDMSFI